ncbi:RHS repeat-associated core domain-containing protein [uncultured Chryseobacterium sp.]|uniref:RHS repeat domain-containing protein n=1 Tax=uncultured Chryseobacterium sp. TaxID=259322 RepID=UPI0025E10556|nr:RHS repeat-associated core domain-containing protein [uncultured Chryseobacterium sp.]
MGTAHFNQVNFYYSPRTIKESSYIRGVPLIQDKKLSQVSIFSNTSLFKNYSIQYSASQNIINNDANNKINYDFVEKIVETNSAGEEADPVIFSTKPLSTSLHESDFGNYNNIITTGDYNGDGLIDFVVMQPAQNGRPDGYYIYFDAVNSSNPSFVYLGSYAMYSSGNGFTTVNVKSADNYIKTRQGLIISKNNAGTNPPTTGSMQLKYYSVKSDASVLNTFNDPLVLEYSKTINPSGYAYSPSIYPPPVPPVDDYNGQTERSAVHLLKEIDIDSDGMSEIIMGIQDSKCYNMIIVPDPLKTIWRCRTLGYRYMVLDHTDLQNNSVHIIPGITAKNILSKGGIMDFDNDGKQDIVFIEPSGINTDAVYYTKSYINGSTGLKTSSVPVNNMKQYELKKQENSYAIELKKSYVIKGLMDGIQFGDLNGDKNIEVLLPLHEYKVNDEYTTGWSVYLNTGADLEESLQGLMLYKKDVSSRPDILSNSAVMDLDGDGKGEILNSYTFFSNINTNFQSNWRLDSYSEPYYNPNDSQFKWRFNEKRLMSSERPKAIISPLFGDFRVNNSLSKVLFLLKATNSSEIKLISYQHYNLNADKNISSVSQAYLQYDIDYKELNPAVSPNLYAPVKKEQYPYVELERMDQSYAVSQIRMGGRKQDFRYRGYIAHLHGKGVIGFRQTARSSWYADNYENTKIWNGVETDPLRDGLPVKEWSIRTNNENLVFPADISENNTQLLSFKSMVYQTDKLVNGQVVTTVAPADKSRMVLAVTPTSNKKKDFLTGTVTASSITYGDYHLPAQSVTNTNNGYEISTSTFEYTHNPSGVGKDYYIGRPKAKINNVSAYGDTKSVKEEYTYENNRLKTWKTWNRDNTAYLLETYEYDGFGNITQKVTGNSIDAQTQTIKSEYEAKGRFVEKKTDNLGLETTATYNNRGQLLAQIDPLGNSLTNIYDAWGKLSESTTSLGGTTTYLYNRESNGDFIVTQNDPDGDVSKKYTNKLGQEYKVSGKAFAQGQYVSVTSEYDILGRKIRESEPYFEGQNPYKWNTISYNDTVFPAKVTATSFTGKKMETSVSGLTTTVKEINGYERTNSKTADAVGNIMSSTDKGGTIQFSYNAAGEQIKAQYAENIVTTKYDAWGRKSEFNDPSNGVYKYEYDGFGQPKKIISPKGEKVFTYNALGQMVSQQELSTNDGGQGTNNNITFSYDTKGRLVSKSGTSHGQFYSSGITYDPQGRVKVSTESSYGRIYSQKEITYDSKGRVSSYEKELQSCGVITKVTIENVYSTWNGDLYQLKDKISGKILWELQETDEKGTVLKGKLGMSTITNTYDAAGFLKTVNHSSAVKPDILKLTYTFDALKNELKYRKTEGDFSIEENFYYDDNNRLINWTDPVTGLEPNSNRNVYDAKGRILQNDQVGTIKFDNTAKIYQPTGMTLSAAGMQNYNNDLIQTITYNENNDPTLITGQKAKIGFEYGLSNMRQRMDIDRPKPADQGPIGEFSVMQSSEDGGGVWDPNAPIWQNSLSKFYSEDGSFEVVKIAGTEQEKHILYIGGSPYESNIIYLKDYGETTGSYKYLHKDYLGSILAISDEAGNKLEQRHYDAWGNFTHLRVGNGAVVTDKATILNLARGLLTDRGYTSHEHLLDVGLIHMNGRLYDPLLRRFLNADENIQDSHNTQIYNKYGYAVNNPLMYNDPNWEFAILAAVPILIVGALKAVVIGSLIYTAMAAITGNASKSGFLKSVFTSFITGGLGAGVGALNVFGNGFWGAVAQGASIGAAGGAVDSIVNNTPVLKGILKGAVIGGTVGAVSYTANYYIKGYNRPKFTTTSDVEVDTNADTNLDLQSMNKNVKDARGNIPNNERFNIDSEGIGLSNSDGFMMNDNGNFNVLGRTDFDFNSGKSNILYSTKAASNFKTLGRVMSHETAHAWSNALGLPNIEIDQARRFHDAFDSIEHLVIRNLEYVYAGKNNIISYVGYVPKQLINFQIAALNSSQKILYNFIYNKFYDIFNITYKFP